MERKWSTAGERRSLLLNIIWLLVSGLPLAIESAIIGVLLCITIVGIPFGLQQFKLAKAGPDALWKPDCLRFDMKTDRGNLASVQLFPDKIEDRTAAVSAILIHRRTGSRRSCQYPLCRACWGVRCCASAAISIITANESEGMDMSSGKITMDDIATMAGVTKSTVSRYFNGGSVRESTRERIQEIIREYNYEPNAFARLKAKGKQCDWRGPSHPEFQDVPAGWSPASDAI